MTRVHGAPSGVKTQTVLTGKDFTCGHVTHWKQCFNGCLRLQLCSPLVVNNSFSWSVHLLWKKTEDDLRRQCSLKSTISTLHDWKKFICLKQWPEVLPWVHCQVLDKGWLPSQAGSAQCRPVNIYVSVLYCFSYDIRIITSTFLFLHLDSKTVAVEGSLQVLIKTRGLQCPVLLLRWEKEAGSIC